MNQINELRTLDLAEIDTVSGGERKIIGVIVQKCTTKTDADGTRTQKCTYVDHQTTP